MEDNDFYEAGSPEEQLTQLALLKHIPISGSLELLPLCNMNCDMCYVRMGREEQERFGRLRTLDEWKALADGMAQAGTMFLMLTGGEPLLLPYFKELYLYLKSLGMILQVNTNGTLIDDAWVSFFKENPPRRLNITLYGASEETYEKLCHFRGFNRAVNGIRRLHAAGVDVKINGSLVEANKDEYPALMDLAAELGCPINIDTHMQPNVRERGKPYNLQSRMAPADAASRLAEIRKREYSAEAFKDFCRGILSRVGEDSGEAGVPFGIRCRAGRTSFVVTWFGKLRPCVMLPEPEADVFELGFAESWNRVREACERIRLNSRCFSCRYRGVCGTCAACGLHEAGAVDALPEYMCEYTEHYVSCLRRYLEGNA